MTWTVSHLELAPIFLFNRSKRTIRIEALLQNGAMGIVVGAQLFDRIDYITPIAIYALIQYIVLMFYIGNINISKIKK